MKKTLFLFSFYFLVFSFPALAQETQRERLERHVYTLAADSLRGRQAGLNGDARAYIAREWQGMGLKAFWGDSLEVPFDIWKQQQLFCNLVAIIEGSDPVLKDEYIVIGGHYDHLGTKEGVVYNGADDNASGAACVTEVARQLLARQKELKRSVIVCAFDAEEVGLYGSEAVAKRIADEGIIGRVKLMLSVDMVGWLKAGGALTLEGTGTLSESVTSDPQALGIDIPIRRKQFEGSILTATDTEPFAKRGIATLAVTTGLKSPYHKPEDDAELIDYEGLDRVTDYLAAFVLEASRQPGELASGRVALKHRSNQRKFEAGLTVGTNTGHVTLTRAAADPKSLSGWTGGLMVQYNFNNTWALHGEALYSFTRCRMPLSDDAFGTGYRMRQESVAVPLTVQASMYSPGVSMYLRAGGYFNYLLHGGMYVDGGDAPAGMPTFAAPTRYRGGLTWGWGFRMARIAFDMNYYYQLGDLFDTSVGLPEAHGSNVTVSLGYFF